jgi:TonB family protein
MSDVPAGPNPAPPNPPFQAPPSRELHLLADRPVEVRFSFEQPQSKVGVGASVLTHLAMLAIAIIVVRYLPEPSAAVLEPPDENPDLIWLAQPGPGGGGGGGGNKTPEPPRKAELPGKEKISVPVLKKPEFVEPKPNEPPPEELNIPAKSLASAEQQLAGVLQSANLATSSQGEGSGGGAGNGTGTGIGSGTGSGLGDGRGGGTGGGAYRPGSGINLPRVLKEVKPQYTADAMRAKVQGVVWLECIVQTDGSVGDVRIIRSLDPVFGLDQEAIKAARQWRFVPGTKQGEPVPVIISIELTFSLR